MDTEIVVMEQERAGERRGRPRHGRPRHGAKRERVSLTLPAEEVELLREIGWGSASMGVSRLLKDRSKEKAQAV